MFRVCSNDIILHKAAPHTGPLPPQSITIHSINTTALHLEWRPSFLWEGYTINYYTIKVYRINGSTAIDQLLNHNDEQVTYIWRNASLPSCTQLNFSIIAVSTQYGVSDPTSVVGGYDTGMFIHNNYAHNVTLK